MFVKKYIMESVLRQLSDNDRRITRLEQIALENSKNAEMYADSIKSEAKKVIASLGDYEAGKLAKGSTIEEVINKSLEV